MQNVGFEKAGGLLHAILFLHFLENSYGTSITG